MTPSPDAQVELAFTRTDESGDAQEAVHDPISPPGRPETGSPRALSPTSVPGVPERNLAPQTQSGPPASVHDRRQSRKVSWARTLSEGREEDFDTADGNKAVRGDVQVDKPTSTPTSSTKKKGCCVAM
eukprot:TRINITY_DN5618_c0_g1_i2.p2 TRINITY_DN5618_c0_g1~~TRINITY_DN5618_c0_g1_i2.p2  ORF type:complete len:128 (+),score=0.71 TRINITY_DN5618_c0_g1_i2:128-511(+)